MPHPLEGFRERFEHRENGCGLALIGNIGALAAPSAAITDTTCLRRASKDEAEEFWKLLLHYGTTMGHPPSRNPFETRTKQEPWGGDLPGVRITWDNLAPESWRYQVLD